MAKELGGSKEKQRGEEERRGLVARKEGPRNLGPRIGSVGWVMPPSHVFTSSTISTKA